MLIGAAKNSQMPPSCTTLTEGQPSWRCVQSENQILLITFPLFKRMWLRKLFICFSLKTKTFGQTQFLKSHHFCLWTGKIVNYDQKQFSFNFWNLHWKNKPISYKHLNKASKKRWLKQHQLYLTLFPKISLLDFLTEISWKHSPFCFQVFLATDTYVGPWIPNVPLSLIVLHVFWWFSPTQQPYNTIIQPLLGYVATAEEANSSTPWLKTEVKYLGWNDFKNVWTMKGL